MKCKLYLLALESIREANKGNPFVTKSFSFSFFNEVIHEQAD